MSEIKQLIALLQQQQEQQQRQMAAQLQQQQEQQQQQMAAQLRQHQEQMKAVQDQNQKLLEALTHGSKTANTPLANFPAFTPFDATSELWSDYWERFLTYAGAHSVPENKRAQVFLTNQTSVTYKLLSSYATQLSPSKAINELTMQQIQEYMKSQFDPTIYIVRERYKFWSDMKRKPGETIHELAARIRQDVVTCNLQISGTHKMKHYEPVSFVP